MAKGGFPGMGGANMQQIMKQAQKMQQDAAKVQDEVGNEEFTVSVGGGMVVAVINGNKEFLSITIDPKCVDPDDVEMLQDLIMSAANEAVRVADDAMESAIGKITGGMKLGI